MDINIKFKRLNDLAKVPTCGSEKAAGYDLYAATSYDIEIEPGQTVKIGTGIAIEPPSDVATLVLARSGLATKKGLAPINEPGLVDSDYRGEIIVALHNHSNEAQTIEAGERIAQLMFVPFYAANFSELDKLSDTDRGEGGFGSTGTK